MERPDLFRRAADALMIRQESDECVLDRAGAGLALEIGRRAAGEHLCVIHGDQPVKAFRFLHVSGGDQHAHVGILDVQIVDQFPELTARQRIDTGCRLIEDQKVRVVNQRAAQAELLSHAAGKLLCRPIGEWSKTHALQKELCPTLTLCARMAEQS